VGPVNTPEAGKDLLAFRLTFWHSRWGGAMETLLKKIEGYLKDFIGDSIAYDAEEEAYVVFYGSTVVKISPLPFGDEKLVEIMAFVVQDVNPTQDLMEHLLFLNYKIPVGAFSLVGRDIFYSHAVLARQLTPDVLKVSMSVVASVADEEDDYIVLKYGGKRAIEKVAQPKESRHN